MPKPYQDQLNSSLFWIQLLKNGTPKKMPAVLVTFPKMITLNRKSSAFQKKHEKKRCQVLPSDPFGDFKWPFQGLSDLHLGYQKVTWKKLLDRFCSPLLDRVVEFLSWTPSPVILRKSEFRVIPKKVAYTWMSRKGSDRINGERISGLYPQGMPHV